MDEWFNTLEQECGIKNPLNDDKKVPQEFWTDERWKKHGFNALEI